MQIRQVYFAGFALLIASAAVSAAPNGAISGKVAYVGTPAKQLPIDMSKEPSCAKQYVAPARSETVVTGPNNTLNNVVVYISAGVPDEAAPAQAVTFTQQGCRYMPHVLAFQVNQELRVVNSDQTSHNIHPMATLNREWNKSQPAGAPPNSAKFDKAEFIPVKCNIHPWMHGAFAVLKNSHYSVSHDDGSFSLPDLPPGKYTVTAWHESYGDQSQEITITGSEIKSVDFVFKAKP